MPEPVPQHAIPRNIVETALEAGKQLAPKVIESPLDDGVPFIVLENADGGQEFEHIVERFDKPHRKSGGVTFNDVVSFLSYFVKHYEHSESEIYGSITPARFVAVLNDHSKDTPGWKDFRATYELKHSKEWMEWAGRSGQKFDGAVAFGEWMENHIPDIIRPEGARMLEIALNLRVTSNAAYSKAVRISDGNTEFTYTNAVEGASRADSGQVRIPEEFAISIPVFEGLAAPRYEVAARFRYRLVSSSLVVWYELIRPHKVVEKAFDDIVKEIVEKAGVPVLFGSPDK